MRTAAFSRRAGVCFLGLEFGKDALIRFFGIWRVGSLRQRAQQIGPACRFRESVFEIKKRLVG